MPTPEQLVAALRAAHPDVAVAPAPQVNSSFLGKGLFTPRDLVHLGEEHAKVPAVMAHELGHAQFNKTRLGRALQHPATRLSTNALGAPLSGLAGLLAARSDSDAAPYAAALVPLALHAPTLVSEAMASRHAMGKLRAAGASAAQLAKARRQLAGAYGTYLGQAGVSGLAAAAPLLARRYWREREAEKTSAEGDDRVGVFEGAPSRRPVMQRALQGALAVGGIGAASSGALAALGPEVMGADRRRRAIRALVGTLGAGMAGAGMGASLGAYEGARFHGQDPTSLSVDMWLAKRLGARDRAAARGQTNA